jgi:hypothetical protein
MSKHDFAALFFVTTVAIFAQVERASVIGNITHATGVVALSSFRDSSSRNLRVNKPRRAHARISQEVRLWDINHEAER